VEAGPNTGQRDESATQDQATQLTTRARPCAPGAVAGTVYEWRAVDAWGRPLCGPVVWM
jgi:hypothetical protein